MGQVLAKHNEGKEEQWAVLTGTGIGCHKTSSPWHVPEDIVQKHVKCTLWHLTRGHCSMCTQCSHLVMALCWSHQRTDLTKAPGNTMSRLFHSTERRPSFVTAARGPAATPAKLSLCLSCHLLYWKPKYVSPTHMHFHLCLEIPNFSSSRSATACIQELPAVTTPSAMLSSVSCWRLTAALGTLLNSLMLQG